MVAVFFPYLILQNFLFLFDDGVELISDIILVGRRFDQFYSVLEHRLILVLFIVRLRLSACFVLNLHYFGRNVEV
jgi:hypothetical protein